ncbi:MULTISPECIES: sensor histidine kinase [unclassified Streptomyces]|uniref:sensor histidine kinase n=1 Tax=unclassified Streptomyces TaxID=2593676 RepID=UPI00380B649F
MSDRIPLRKRLSARLLLASALIALCSVGATAWIAVATTTRALKQEQGQDLAAGNQILAELSGYAATHPDWKGVQGTLRALAAKTGRRIALTSADRTLIADSATTPTALPPAPAASVDPLRIDTYTETGAQLSGVDPRAVGPYRLTASERAHLRAAARNVLSCATSLGEDARIETRPGGRPVLRAADGSNMTARFQARCGSALGEPTPTEQRAVADLTRGVRACLTKRRLTLQPPLSLALNTTGDGDDDRFLLSYVKTVGRGDLDTVEACVASARRAQLAPYVAPVAELFLGIGDRAAPRFDMSPVNKAKVAGAAGLVLAFTVAVTAVVATRLVRPLRALTEAAQQPPQHHVRVPVTTRDETGILAEAFNDLTERRERLEDQRKAMVSDIAHELRTPLTNIRGWLEVTRDGVVDADPALLSSLHDEALVLQRIIDDLQDLAAADAGTLRLHREPVRVDELLQQVAAAHGIAADTAGVALRTESDAALWLDADPVRMRQALGNLVSNAVRHTPADGTVTLTARREGAWARFTVTDTGTGIDPADLPHVFERFWRAEKSRSRRTGGSGLGLSIVRHLIAAHEGTVAADSAPGQGATFTLHLPATEGPEA